jgi:hypothetical protein
MSRNDARPESKRMKKDQSVQRDVLSEIDEATDLPEAGNAETQFRHVNRDQARGDWDRSRRLDERAEREPTDHKPTEHD